MYHDNRTLEDRVYHGEDGIVLPSCLHMAYVRMGYVSEDIVPNGLLVAPCVNQSLVWRRVGLFCLHDTTLQRPLDPEWLKDGCLTDVVLV